MTSTLAGFADLGVPAPLVTALDRSGITTPFPIQSATLPDSLAGRDVLGRGRTGSGKTIAFGLPMLAALATSKTRREPSRPRALVLVPTRELANQVADALTPLARALSLNVTTVIGGAGQRPQVDSLRRGTDVLVACPGRLEDLIRQRHCRLDRVEVTVVDEADLMADLGFLPAVQRLLDQTPKGGQRLLFSATLDHGIDGLVRRYLNDPVTHAVDSEASAPPELDHHVLTVSTGDKPAIVHQLASGNQRALLFTRTKHGAKKLAARLSAAGIPTTELHGNLAQAARERNLAAFANGSAARARRHRHRVARHPCRRHRARGPRRPAGRAQGVPPPLGTHCACRRFGHRRHGRDARAGQGRACTRSSRSCPPDDHQGHPGALVARGARGTAAGAFGEAGADDLCKARAPARRNRASTRAASAKSPDASVTGFFAKLSLIEAPPARRTAPTLNPRLRER